MNNLVLIVEDEIKLAKLLEDYLCQANYTPKSLHDGNDVLPWLADNEPKAVLLDIMLPGKNGIELCKAIRKFSNVPILMVTAKVDEIDRLLGLELGADDYICKPFSPREVVARVNAVLRRTHSVTHNNNQLHLDEHRFTVCYNQQETQLTAVEFQLLKPLAEHPERIFTRDQLMQNMYSDHRVVNNRTIDSHIKKLRKKLSEISNEKDWIHSVYATGYRLAP